MNPLELWQALISHPEFWAIASIPFVTAIVTWAHVWMALQMLFYPIKFVGIKVKNMPLGLPGIGWQGIVPHKAGKISGKIVDQTLSKLGSLDEFFQAMNPDEMADFITQEVDNNIENLIDEIMMERSATLWKGLPYALKRRIYNHVHGELPQVMKELVNELTYHVEDLVDMREMIVNKMESDRRLMVNMFLKVGKKEINFIWHISALIGIFFGTIQMFVYIIVPSHNSVPIFAAVWGIITNAIAIWMVFHPVYPHYFSFIKLFRLKLVSIPLGKFKLPIPLIIPVKPHIAKYNWQGGFMKRQEEVSIVFSEIVVQDLVTIEVIMNEMMYGKYSMKTRELMKVHLNEMLETPLVQTTLKLGLGRREFGQLKNTILDKSIDATMTPIRDPELNDSRAKKIFGLFRDRIRALSPLEFQKLLRPAFQEDETTLIVLGGITGGLAGYLHLVLFFH